MKLNYIYSIIITTFLLVFSACKKDFFDLKPYDSVPLDKAITDENTMANAINGVYSGLRSSNLYGRSLPFINDLMADNIYLSTNNSGRYVSQYNYSVTAQDQYPRDTWSQAYTVIQRANNIINSKITDNTNIKQYRGEALTARALMYFELVRMFAKPYTKDPNALGVPIVLVYDPSLRPARNKVSEVYDQIIKDLLQAFDLMSITDKNSNYISKYVSKAILSKVYLYKGDFTNAQTVALDVVSNGGYTLAASTDFAAYWARSTAVTNKLETILEISADDVNNVGSDALSNMYSQSGYGDGIATPDLYNLYSSTDVRKSLIIKYKRTASDTLIVNKYKNTSSTDKDDLKVLRYADVLLILAESYYRNSDETNALVYLNVLAKKRDPSFAGYSSSSTQLLDDIITERRKELAFEGDRFNDLNRLIRPIVRNSPLLQAGAKNIAVDDTRRVAPIPQVELDSNPNMVKNDGY